MTSRAPTRLLAALEREIPGLGAIEGAEPVSGGDTHGALAVHAQGGTWFVKWGDAAALPLFEAEHRGLKVLAASDGPRVPRSRAFGASDAHAWLVTEHLPLRRRGDSAALGRSLAAMHRNRGPAHGFEADNFIGQTPQVNDWRVDWTEFWWECRLLPQLRAAGEQGFAAGAGPLVAPLERACRILLDHAPVPSLLHGDLWSGNHAYLGDGTPVIFDPACAYGDRETDIAMMKLFGGFDADVFRAYSAARPLPAGHDRRCGLYQLYHVLNHLNLFGAAWLGRVRALAREVLTAAGIA